MVLDLSPGVIVTVEGQQYTVEELSSIHDEDFRLDVAHLIGATPAHERWLVAVLPEPYLMLMQRLGQEWLAAPVTSIAHDGEIFQRMYHGGGYRARRGKSSKSKEGRVEYALFRADSGRVILILGRNDDFDAWIGNTVQTETVLLPKGGK